MRFRRNTRENPEINLIPFIDVLLVVLIFLMLSTSYANFTELQVTLPTADADASRDRPREITVSVSADGRYSVNGDAVDGRSVELLTMALSRAAEGRNDMPIIVSADATSAHQSVINVMDAARRAGLARITFAAQRAAPGGAR